MPVKKSSIVRMAIALPLLLLMVQPLRAQTSGGNSESDRIQKLERAVEQLQKQNADLQKEVSSLKKQVPLRRGGAGQNEDGGDLRWENVREKVVEEKPHLRPAAWPGVEACPWRIHSGQP